MHPPVHIIIATASSCIILLPQKVFHFHPDHRISKVDHFHHIVKDLISLPPFIHYYILDFHIIRLLRLRLADHRHSCLPLGRLLLEGG